MGTAPLFVKYRTAHGQCYLYDVATQEIIRVGEVVYNVVDDFHILTDQELVEKHERCVCESAIREAVAQLEFLQHRRVFCDHAPTASIAALQVTYHNRKESFKDFLGTHRRALVIELTQRCNMRCVYCAYGEYYPEVRAHGEDTICAATAKDAIRAFMGHDATDATVSFFGGEPLLEFELLSDLVAFAEAEAQQHGVRIDFALTTNGTLLDDERIHFLAAHKFRVKVSLDGPKHATDRYRVFAIPAILKALPECTTWRHATSHGLSNCIRIIGSAVLLLR